jgi:hypothetical protein
MQVGVGEITQCCRSPSSDAMRHLKSIDTRPHRSAPAASIDRIAGEYLVISLQRSCTGNEPMRILQNGLSNSSWGSTSCRPCRTPQPVHAHEVAGSP